MRMCSAPSQINIVLTPSLRIAENTIGFGHISKLLGGGSAASVGMVAAGEHSEGVPDSSRLSIFRHLQHPVKIARVHDKNRDALLRWG